MNKKILIVIIVLAFVCIGIGCFFFLKDKSSANNGDNEEPIVSNEKHGKKLDDGMVITSDTDIGMLFDVLFKYAAEIYDKKGYSKYSKVDGMYFISLNQLSKDFKYDISMFHEENKLCDRDLSGVSFDIDNTLNIEYSSSMKPILPKLVGCFDDYKQ